MTKLIRFLSYPVFFDPESPRAVGYVMKHFWAIRSRTRSRRLLKRLARPAVPWIRKRGKERLENHLRFERLRPFLDRAKPEVIIDARRFFRIIDFDRRKVVNILKNKDLSPFFDNEVTARQRLAGADFIPRLFAVDRKAGVFSEEFICERPFKSGSLRDLDAAGFAGRLKEIVRKVQDSAPVRVVETEDYLAGLSGEILSRPEADKEVRRYVRSLKNSASRLDRVELVFSHGDLRPDQLFFAPDGSIRIIDWENSGCFCRCRDLLDFFVNERWLCTDSEVSLQSFLEEVPGQLKALTSLYLLEQAVIPVRIGRALLLPVSIAALKGVEHLLNKAVRDHGRPRPGYCLPRISGNRGVDRYGTG